MARYSALADRDRLGDRYLDLDSPLSRVLRHAPYLTGCSDDKSVKFHRPRHLAVGKSYMQLNPPTGVAWLIFDLDHPNPFIWDQWGPSALPPPNLIVQDPLSLKSHLLYAVAPICTTEKGRRKPQTYMRAVYAAMCARLHADADYHSGPLAKTPGHPKWRTLELHNREYHLGDLAQHLDLPRIASIRADAKDAQFEKAVASRHCALFHQLRFIAYALVTRERDQGSFESFSARLLREAQSLNDFGARGNPKGDLPHSSIRATVRSIARWTWDCYRGKGGINRGVMRLSDATPLADRQAMAARRTAAIRCAKTAERLAGATKALLLAGKAVTLGAVAIAAKLSRQTAAKYRSVIDQIMAKGPGPAPRLSPIAQPAQVLAPLKGGDHAARVVNFAVHQVTAAWADRGTGMCRAAASVVVLGRRRGQDP